MTGGGGEAPPFGVQDSARSANLNTPAQLTPRYIARQQERRRRRLAQRRRALHTVKAVARMAAPGLGRGLVQKDESNLHWDISGRCENPVPVVIEGAGARLVGIRHVRDHRALKALLTLTLETKCRKCPACLRARRNLWAYRAKEEVAKWSRTWFATFTFTPHNHAVLAMRASARLSARGTDIELLSAADREAIVSREYGAEITKYFKRLRKNTGADLRYILVTERHKNGLIHYHALIHEVDPSNPVRHASLTASWKLGFTQFKLVNDPQCAWYVAKYLNKDAEARVRASLRYGRSADHMDMPTYSDSKSNRNVSNSTNKGKCNARNDLGKPELAGTQVNGTACIPQRQQEQYNGQHERHMASRMDRRYHRGTPEAAKADADAKTAWALLSFGCVRAAAKQDRSAGAGTAGSGQGGSQPPSREPKLQCQGQDHHRSGSSGARGAAPDQSCAPQPLYVGC